MNIVYLSFLLDKNPREVEAFSKSSSLPHPLLAELSKNSKDNIHVVQRATFKSTKKVKNIEYHFIKDEFEPKLLWWQEPVAVIEHISAIKPDLIIVHGLNLPLQFRWLRRQVGDRVKIIGEHTGETIWANRNLWLQQFGLRVVDGFIFKTINDSFEWTKASVILERQPIAEISLFSKNPEATSKSLLKFYNDLHD